MYITELDASITIAEFYKYEEEELAGVILLAI